MPFVACGALYVPTPGKLYVHGSGFAEAFGNNVRTARDHAYEVLSTNPELFTKTAFFLAELWGDRGTKVLHLSRYGGIGRWPGNPDIYEWIVFRDGVPVPNEFELRDINRIVSSGDMSIAFAAEEKWRRLVPGLDEWMKSFPYLKEIQDEPLVLF